MHTPLRCLILGVKTVSVSVPVLSKRIGPGKNPGTRSSSSRRSVRQPSGRQRESWAEKQGISLIIRPDLLKIARATISTQLYGDNFLDAIVLPYKSAIEDFLPKDGTTKTHRIRLRITFVRKLFNYGLDNPLSVF
ncbi:hypothetical protein NPIL_645761 [Nephila pilipes]|uniref:Uncharacterized protein n=1 Tax=Nephila pilipes TaxID=299642 RepID=A0A8X6NDI9_NEPPI|nr:hypothetical protein NPIL_645761 [Nephila pilipes]